MKKTFVTSGIVAREEERGRNKKFFGLLCVVCFVSDWRRKMKLNVE
jgi:hypothetical protein